MTFPVFLATKATVNPNSTSFLSFLFFLLSLASSVN
uniref:Uncharacterized protein n=1 Tax=Rhizophora mucronata TaxID=61149 RepID=A0A2P2NVA8_RHIMU